MPMTGVRLGDIADAYLNIADDIKRLQVGGEEGAWCRFDCK